MGIEALWSAQERDEVRLGYQRIENILKKCHQTESLLWISERSQYAFNNPDFWDQIDEHHIHPWLLAFIARTLLKVTSDTNRPRTLDHSIYEEIWNIYYKLNSPGEDRTLNFAQLFLINITYEQFYWQESIKNLIPRYYLILSHRADEQDRLRKKRNELTEYISAMTGLDFVDYMRLSFIAWMTMREIGHYDPARITGHTIKAFHETCTESKVNAFTSFVSKGKKGLRDMINSQANSHPLMEAYCLNPLFRHPIVNLGSTSIAPVPRLLLDKSTHGLYYDLFDYTRAHSKDTQYLPNSFGLLVNDYVGMLLQTRYERNHQLRCGDDFDIGMYTGKRCDWIIVEDDSVVLMEVKSTRFSRQVIESWSINEFREFVRERYLKAAEQLLAFKDTLRSEFGQSQFYLIILVIEQFPFFNLLPKFFDDSDPALNLIRDNRVQFVNISELEVFLANRRFRLSSILEDKIENEDTSIKPFSPFVSRLDGYKWNKSLPLLERTLSDIFKWKELHATSSCNQ